MTATEVETVVGDVRYAVRHVADVTSPLAIVIEQLGASDASLDQSDELSGAIGKHTELFRVWPLLVHGETYVARRDAPVTTREWLARAQRFFSVFD
jgi:hypothetical protein